MKPLIFVISVLILAIFAGRNLMNLTKTEPTPERVEACLNFRENALRCKEQVVNAMVDLQASQMEGVDERLKQPEERRKVVQMGIAQLEQDGAGTLTERTNRCIETVRKSPAPKPEDLAALDACYAEEDCDALVDCIQPILERQLEQQK